MNILVTGANGQLGSQIKYIENKTDPNNDNWYDFDTKKCLLERFIRPKDLKTNY